MRLRTLVPAVALGAVALGGCRADTALTNPSTPTVATFWQTANDASAGLTAAYNSLNQSSTFLRWYTFSYDIRADVGTSFSPWTDLANHSKFAFSNYDFEIVRDSWYQSYQGISRANQVIAYVPTIAMDAATGNRYVAEAKFLRGLHYFHLLTLYGGNIPLITEPVTVTDRPGPAGEAAIYAQLEQDLSEAAAALPKTAFASAGGHAVAASAQGMLGKVLLQEKKWAEAAAALAPIVNQQYGMYALVLPGEGGYASLFTLAGNNSTESLFETEVGSLATAPLGVYGNNIPKFLGPCGPSFCDGRPTRWFFNQFFIDSTTDGQRDPRIDATVFYYRGDTTMVHNLTWGQRRAGSDSLVYKDTTNLFFKKYSDDAVPADKNDITIDAAVNVKILRYADILLMYAEALNEQGQTGEAAQYINQVRARVNLRPVTATDQVSMRAAILHERLLELAEEGQRWNDLARAGLLSAAGLPTLISHDDEFKNFTPGKSELYPIPTSELDLNPNLKQNPGWGG